MRFFFNKPTNITDGKIYYPLWLYFEAIEWICESDMTDSEKTANSDYPVCGGYLKVNDYKESIQKKYNSATEEEKRSIEDLPNYDAKVLFELFGIKR